MNIRTHQMFTGLAAGNIGDELMMLGFLERIQPADGSTIEVWREDSPAVSWFPDTCRYVSWMDDLQCEQSVLASRAVLMVGGTPVSHLVGLDWPLRSLRKRLRFCHENRIPVHAVGVGVDHLTDPEAVGIFEDAFLPVASWSVRSANCRHALMSLGVPEDRIVVASDLAWLYEPAGDVRAWARSQWQALGIDVDRPLIGVNIVREVWGKNSELFRSIALALDRIADRHRARIAFMCNEVREGAYFDHEAAKSVMAMMKTPAVFLPNRYYHPDEMIGLLSLVDVSLSQRYHFTVQSVLAGTVPVSFARGEKLAVLMDELGMDAAADMDRADPDAICRCVSDALERRDYWRSHLVQMKRHLKLRALNNGSFIRHLSPSIVKPASFSVAGDRADLLPLARLADVQELKSVNFQAVMAMINGFAARWGLRVITNWSKVWEYPWIWFNALYRIAWPGKHLVDIGSEISPMPWMVACMGASVTLIETDSQWVPLWEKLKDRLQADVRWHIVTDETLPVADGSADVVTSFSVIEHQPDKAEVVDEIDRILKPGGMLAISFDICEPDRGMSFPEWNGTALTMHEFETLIWRHPAFANRFPPIWNLSDIPPFLAWYKTTAPHHRYVVGAAVLQKKCVEPPCTVRFVSGWFDEETDATGAWHWCDHAGSIELACKEALDMDVSFELCSIPSDNRVTLRLDEEEPTEMAIGWLGFQPVSPVHVRLEAGVHQLAFRSRKAPVKLPSDARMLAFSVKNIAIKIKNKGM